MVTALLAVESCAVLLVVGGLVVPPAAVDPGAQVRTLILLLVVACLAAELGRDAERARRRTLVSDLHVNMASVWFLAAAATLAPGWAGLCAVLVHAHLWWRSTGPRVAPHRQAFTAAVFVLATVAASAVMTWLRGGLPAAAGVLVYAVGILTFFVVNTALIAGAMAAAQPRTGLGEVVGSADGNLLELATLCVGALVALAMAVDPWLVLLAVPPLLVLQRAALVRHLEKAASIDAKTGLLNAAAWHARADRAIRDRRHGAPAAALLVLDLDHFKRVNDTYGHLVGDDVLAAVADALRAEVRDGDLVGRFGGEEFVILLAVGPEGAGPGVRDSAADAACSVADRIRRRVAALTVPIATADGPLSVARLSVSVGAAVCPAGGADLRALVHAADMALLDAKRDGRDRVRLSAVQAVQAVQASSAVVQAQSAPAASVVAASVVAASEVTASEVTASVVTASAAPLSPAP